MASPENSVWNSHFFKKMEFSKSVLAWSQYINMGYYSLKWCILHTNWLEKEKPVLKCWHFCIFWVKNWFFGKKRVLRPFERAPIPWCQRAVGSFFPILSSMMSRHHKTWKKPMLNHVGVQKITHLSRLNLVPVTPRDPKFPTSWDLWVGSSASSPDLSLYSWHIWPWFEG